MKLTAANIVSEPSACSIVEDWCARVGDRLTDDIADVEALPDVLILHRTVAVPGGHHVVEVIHPW